MKFKHFIIPLIVIFLVQCTRVPITNRKQLLLIPESEMIALSLSSYTDYLKKNPPVVSGADADMVKRVGNRIKNAVQKYMVDNKQAQRLDGYQWEFNLVADSTVNAWCMSGGKVVVYTGILKYTQDEPTLGIVLGHEIAHAVARHGNERMTQGLLVAVGDVTLEVATANKSKETHDLLMASYGVTSSLGILAYSRQHESEADKMGLIFAAMAGYDPHVAVSFWERMGKQGDKTTPVILRTHPTDKQRVESLKAFMPTAMKYYKPL